MQGNMKWLVTIMYNTSNDKLEKEVFVLDGKDKAELDEKFSRFLSTKNYPYGASVYVSSC